MAVFLVDYENVNAMNGLKGTEYLRKEDVIYIFYSQCCGKIKAEHMEDIIKSRCRFHIFKLKNVGKNALDFYIASQVGECIGGLGEDKIAIVSRDKGFKAVTDFWSIKSESDHQVVLASSIEQGIIRLNQKDDEERCKEIRRKTCMLDLASQYEKYKQRIQAENDIKSKFFGTSYEELIEEIYLFAQTHGRCGKKKLYTGALHVFGREKGRYIYNALKELHINL